MNQIQDNSAPASLPLSDRGGVRTISSSEPSSAPSSDLPSESAHWYAAKVFYNRAAKINDELTHSGVETYLPITYISHGEDSEGSPRYRQQPLASLLFLRVTTTDALHLRRQFYGRFLFYDRKDEKGLRVPAPIPDMQMEQFRRVTAVEDPRLEYLSYDPALFASGKRVEVTGGPFAGAQGVIKRIRHDRRFLIELQGICLVATSYIPQSLLRPL